MQFCLRLCLFTLPQQQFFVVVVVETLTTKVNEAYEYYI